MTDHDGPQKNIEIPKADPRKTKSGQLCCTFFYRGQTIDTTPEGNTTSWKAWLIKSGQLDFGGFFSTADWCPFWLSNLVISWTQLNSAELRLNMIFNLLGTPTEADINLLEREDARRQDAWKHSPCSSEQLEAEVHGCLAISRYIRCFAARDGDGIKSKFPQVDDDCVDILDSGKTSVWKPREVCCWFMSTVMFCCQFSDKFSGIFKTQLLLEQQSFTCAAARIWMCQWMFW